ncbi:MAG: DEAD/DEAH box helicase [Acidobacteria bacterium]|nr:DEAD/DEAH box helicase [Acidobacteriota bacterium]MCB9396933.1 DEAD/DEAH box helicase [Acidobacteriota bacterium]
MRNPEPSKLLALRALHSQIPADIRQAGEFLMPKFVLSRKSDHYMGAIQLDDHPNFMTQISFDPDRDTINGCACNCTRGKRGQICEHLAGFVAALMVELDRSPNESASTLDFLDKYLLVTKVDHRNIQLEIDIEASDLGVTPQIHLVRFQDGIPSPRRRLTAAESYKLDQTDPFDQNLVEYIKNFRQILFYSQYAPYRKYPWGFWLTLSGHPRLRFQGQDVELHPADLELVVQEFKGGFWLGTNLTKSGTPMHSFPVEGGLLNFLPEEKRLLLCQVDGNRAGLVREIVEQNPVLSKELLLSNLHRLEKLQKIFHVRMPEKLLKSMSKAEPELILIVDLNPFRGFSLRPRIVYNRVKGDVLPGEGQLYLQAGNDVIRRELETEREMFRQFQMKFPEEWGDLDSFECEIADLDEAFRVIDWLKSESGLKLVWTRKKPKIRKWQRNARIALHMKGPSSLKIELTHKGEKHDLTPLFAEEQGPLLQKYLPVGENDWLQIDALLRAQLNRLRFALDRSNPQLDLKRIAPALLADMPFELVGQSPLLERVRRMQSAKAAAQPPEGFLGDLRHYQLEGYAWLSKMSEAGIGVCLADDMGLGKTVQALAIMYARKSVGPCLVVAPASVVFNWKEEIDRFAPDLDTMVYSEVGRSRRFNKIGPGHVVLISYALVLRDCEKLSKVNWGTLVLDEAQFVKNALSKTARALAQIPRDWTLGLTGTPLENHLGELWSIFRMISPDILGDWSHFKRRFMGPIEKQNNQERLDILKSLIGPFVLRRTKKQVLNDLPDRTEVLLKVDLGDQQIKRYEEERLRLLGQLDKGGENLGFKVLAGITRLRQMACHPILVDEKYKGDSAKIRLFSELIQELVAESHSALVFSQFTGFLDQIGLELNRIHVPFLTMTGETPVKHRKSIIKRFQSGEVGVFLVSLRAGGTGLNLTQANYVFHMDPWWNPAVEEQATDRAHRMGQTRAVTVYRMIAAHTIEESILRIHEKKRDLVDRILEGQEQAENLDVDAMIQLIRDQALA